MRRASSMKKKDWQDAKRLGDGTRGKKKRDCAARLRRQWLSCGSAALRSHEESKKLLRQRKNLQILLATDCS
jgi:hypothetical protein